MSFTLRRTFSDLYNQRSIKRGWSSLCILKQLHSRAAATATFFTSARMESPAMSVSPPKCLMKPMDVPSKLLMGPGPSNCPPRVLAAGSLPMLGHLHPEFTKVTRHHMAGDIIRYLIIRVAFSRVSTLMFLMINC